MKLEDVINALDRMENAAHAASNCNPGSTGQNSWWDNFEQEKDTLIGALREVWVDSSPLPAAEPVKMTASECLKLLNFTRLDLLHSAKTSDEPLNQRRRLKASAIQFAIDQMLKLEGRNTLETELDCLRHAIHAFKNAEGSDSAEQLKHIKVYIEKMLDEDYRKEIGLESNGVLSLKVVKVICALNAMREEREQIKKVFALLRCEVTKA